MTDTRRIQIDISVYDKDNKLMRMRSRNYVPKEVADQIESLLGMLSPGGSSVVISPEGECFEVFTVS